MNSSRQFSARSSLLLLFCCFCLNGCIPIVIKFISRAFDQISLQMDTVYNKNDRPIFPTVGLSVLWVGHATCLIQIGDKVFLTDPLFTSSIGGVSKRHIEPGLLPSSITSLDFILISHLHFDHLSYSSLDMLPKSSHMILPPGGSAYVPEMNFSSYRELAPWQTMEKEGVSITAVPVKHFNGRYGFDASWSNNDSFTGYIIQYQGKTVFFAGDTGYDQKKFLEIGNRFSIDVALIPIAPIEPRDFMKHVHTDPAEALQVFDDVRAKIMIPIHHRTFMQGFDSTMTYASEQLHHLVVERRLEDRVYTLKVGEQRILIP